MSTIFDIRSLRLPKLSAKVVVVGGWWWSWRSWPLRPARGSTGN
ncbi:Uncharacterised protein [Mycobacterium tuberculosis]|nr:Uncharacterised protein [Mycobacterium tuberculosis]SGB34555.1 Uncharacterised protein [Mycobacterium tuberculosis]SGO28671.1 Uncharacterised protein [Mycobacterium tuberculosis]